MNVYEALLILESHYKINKDLIKEFLLNYNVENNKSNNSKNSKVNKNIILPFTGVIFEDCCKGIVFNHGLYTQCTIKTKDEFCKKCIPQKYGKIQDRLNFELGKFKCKTGKMETSYENFAKKMNYDYDDIMEALREKNLTYNLLTPEIRSRSNDVEVIEVRKKCINKKEYLITQENVLLDINSYEIVGYFEEK
tara:strand:- start:182 stop:760 length:579 start_codon:yes stop_codon:yes gene_type:complete